MRPHSEENAMKRICAFLALVLSLALAGAALAQDKAGTEAKKDEAKPAAAAAAAAAPAAPTKPELVDAAKINSGDTAWMLTSTALVLMMTIPGLALFYGGMVRKKNVLATVMQSFAITCLVTVLWTVLGYSLAFTEGSPYIGGLGRLVLAGMGLEAVNDLAKTIPESVYMTYQMTFAIL